jgi:hypothetical protein
MSLALVLVHWQDIVSAGDPWISSEEALALKPAKMITAGLILKETNDYIVIASTIEHAGDPQYGDVNAIPKGCIEHIQPLEHTEAQANNGHPHQ